MTPEGACGSIINIIIPVCKFTVRMNQDGTRNTNYRAGTHSLWGCGPALSTVATGSVMGGPQAPGSGPALAGD